MIFLYNIQRKQTKELKMATNSFERGMLNSLKELLKKATDLEIKYQHNGATDPYFTYTVKDGGTEVFYLKYSREEKRKDNPITFRLFGKTQNWSEEVLKELYEAVDSAWWDQDKRKREAEEQSKTDKVKAAQEELKSQMDALLMKKGIERKTYQI